MNEFWLWFAQSLVAGGLAVVFLYWIDRWYGSNEDEDEDGETEWD